MLNETVTPGVYRTRDEFTVEIEQIVGEGHYPAIGRIVRSPTGSIAPMEGAWALNGKYMLDIPQHDLVERVDAQQPSATEAGDGVS